jgi:hypothetical protein
MTAGSRIRIFAATAIGAAGLLLAHWVAYVLAVPDSSHRETLLARTGHGYMPGAAEIAGALALGAVLALILSRLVDRHPEDPPTLPRLAGAMTALQASIFAAVEIAERVASRAPLDEMIHDHVLLIGIAIQVLVATLGALLLRWLDRAAGRLERICARSFAPGSSADPLVLPIRHARRSPVLAGAAGVRGPPLL